MAQSNVVSFRRYCQSTATWARAATRAIVYPSADHSKHARRARARMERARAALAATATA